MKMFHWKKTNSFVVLSTDPLRITPQILFFRPSRPIYLNVHIEFDPGMVGKCVLVQCIQLFFSQTLFNFKRLVSHSISPKFSGKIPYVFSKHRICFWGPKIKVLFQTSFSRSGKRTLEINNSCLKLNITTRKENWGMKMARGIFPENLRKIELETNVLQSNKICEKRVVNGTFPWKRTKKLEFRRYFKNNPTKEEIRG